MELLTSLLMENPTVMSIVAIAATGVVVARSLQGLMQGLKPFAAWTKNKWDDRALTRVISFLDYTGDLLGAVSTGDFKFITQELKKLRA